MPNKFNRINTNSEHNFDLKDPNTRFDLNLPDITIIYPYCWFKTNDLSNYRKGLFITINEPIFNRDAQPSCYIIDIQSGLLSHTIPNLISFKNKKP